MEYLSTKDVVIIGMALNLFIVFVMFLMSYYKIKDAIDRKIDVISQKSEQIRQAQIQIMAKQQENSGK